FSTQVALPFVENFDFPADDNLTMHGWVAHSAAGTNPITVNSGGLTFVNYPSSGIGNAALVDNTSEDIHRLFENVVSGSVYMSFMVNVVNNPAGYFIHYAPNPHNTFDFRGRVWVKGTAPALAFGLSFASSDTIVTAPIYSLGTTYLVVVKYEVVAGNLNDVVSLYVFSEADPFPGVEPAPTLGPHANATTSADILPGSVNIRQYNSTQNCIVDGIRIGTSWTEVVPVELTSFFITSNGNKVTLNWSTASELNNKGFEIQRSSQGSEFETIGFTPGYGTTTETNNYSFVDANIATGTYSYRLKQIDFDGTFSFSKQVYVDVTAPAQFQLSQNYPNPFNPSTSIDFSLTVDSKVSLKVFNVLGQEVASLLNGTLTAGSHQVNFDASALNSGVYLYRIETTGSNGTNFINVKKMILTK
ncbi:MAG: T9SS type A sorting domain-containing protein, partial [Ignavibacteria bacterium]|nr:T9SS type A sorting domain-containing protein [Ignavibacteria bacterium]